MKLLIGEDAVVAQWVAEHIPQMSKRGLASFGPSTAIGVCADDGTPLAGTVYHNYFPHFRNVEISCASVSKRWLTKTVITQLLSYPFDQLDCVRLTAVTPRKATSTRTFLENLGFVREGVHWRAFGDDDAISYCLKRKVWSRSRFNLKRVALDGQGNAHAAGPRGPKRRRERTNCVQPADRPVPIAAE